MWKSCGSWNLYATYNLTGHLWLHLWTDSDSSALALPIQIESLAVFSVFCGPDFLVKYGYADPCLEVCALRLSLVRSFVHLYSYPVRSEYLLPEKIEGTRLDKLGTLFLHLTYISDRVDPLATHVNSVDLRSPSRSRTYDRQALTIMWLFGHSGISPFKTPSELGQQSDGTRISSSWSKFKWRNWGMIPTRSDILLNIVTLHHPYHKYNDRQSSCPSGTDRSNWESCQTRRNRASVKASRAISKNLLQYLIARMNITRWCHAQLA